MNEKQPEREVVWVDRWLSGGTPESRINVPVSFVSDGEDEDEHKR